MFSFNSCASYGPLRKHKKLPCDCFLPKWPSRLQTRNVSYGLLRHDTPWMRWGGMFLGAGRYHSSCYPILYIPVASNRPQDKVVLIGLIKTT